MRLRVPLDAELDSTHFRIFASNGSYLGELPAVERYQERQRFFQVGECIRLMYNTLRLSGEHDELNYLMRICFLRMRYILFESFSEQFAGATSSQSKMDAAQGKGMVAEMALPGFDDDDDDDDDGDGDGGGDEAVDADVAAAAAAVDAAAGSGESKEAASGSAVAAPADAAPAAPAADAAAPAAPAAGAAERAELTAAFGKKKKKKKKKKTGFLSQ